MLKNLETKSQNLKRKISKKFLIPKRRLKMQREVSIEVKTGDSVTPFKSVEKSPTIDKTASDFDNMNLKVKKIRRLIEHGIYDAGIARYITGILNLVFQGMIDKIMAIEQTANQSYKDKENFNFELTFEFYTNLKSLHICFLIKFKKLSNATANLDEDIYPINNFFPTG